MVETFEEMMGDMNLELDHQKRGLMSEGYLARVSIVSRGTSA